MRVADFAGDAFGFRTVHDREMVLDVPCHFARIARGLPSNELGVKRLGARSALHAHAVCKGGQAIDAELVRTDAWSGCARGVNGLLRERCRH